MGTGPTQSLKLCLGSHAGSVREEMLFSAGVTKHKVNRIKPV